MDAFQGMAISIAIFIPVWIFWNSEHMTRRCSEILKLRSEGMKVINEGQNKYNSSKGKKVRVHKVPTIHNSIRMGSLVDGND